MDVSNCFKFAKHTGPKVSLITSADLTHSQKKAVELNKLPNEKELFGLAT